MNTILLKRNLSRSELLSLRLCEDNARLRVAVHRNHAFELAASVLNVFLNESGLTADLSYSDYDDSLSFADFDRNADLHLVWLDASRYSTNVFQPWLRERLLYLRQLGARRILLACCGLSEAGGALEPMSAHIVACNLDQELELPEENIYDPRLAALAGTRLSNAALLGAARLLGLRYFPAMLRPCLKALVLDLDNTLHEGVLGEDGINGVKPYVRLQERLKELARQGFLLALASKNDERDVRELFAQRTDFPLRLDDFVCIEANWGSKAESLRRIAAFCNIGLDSILFADDNPGEILQVRHELPEVHTLPAGSEGDTLAALRWQPGLFKLRTTTEDALRGADLAANTKRGLMRKSLSTEDYLRELKLELSFGVNLAAEKNRITELLNKTNQFILSFSRPSVLEVEEYLTGSDACVVTAAMKDALSDSGLIAAALFRLEPEGPVLTDLAVSCRALGRGVEGGMISKMLELGGRFFKRAGAVRVPYTRGPRNAPALDWLKSASGTGLESESGAVFVDWSGQNVADQLKAAKITVIGYPGHE